MKGYRDYMDRQQVSPALHDKLLALEQQQKAPAKAQPLKYWKPVLATAACLCLVVGVCWGWSAFSSSANSAASTAEYAMDAAAQDAAEEAILESAAAAPEESDSLPTEDTGSFTAEAAASAADQAASEEVPEQEEDVSVETDSADEAAKEILTPPEDARLPGWLPEGYALSAVEPRADGGCRLTWSDGTAEITLEYAADQPPEELCWPVYDRETADWETVSQSEAQGDTWGFCLYDEELGYWQCFTTTGEHETLWDVAQSMAR